MKIILLSGGSGKRLWPLSSEARSKQFLKVLENRNGQKESMVQRVWAQLESVGLHKSTIIATSKSQKDMLQSQLGSDVPLIVEQERRDTFPAIALSTTYLYSIEGISLDEVICILPVDPYVEDHFFNKVKELEDIIKVSESEMALIGVKPTYPSSKYGYIIPEENNKNLNYLQVNSFQEKPIEAVAKDLIEKNALWNCGVFAFRLDYIINMLQQKGLPIQYEELNKRYHELPKISFDYEVVEKTTKRIVLPYDGYWKDLGTWNTLTDEMASNQIGRGTICDNSSNTHLINELDIPVIVLGISNIVVAVSPDGILVTDKELSTGIKELIEVDQRPMYEERLWGWYRVLDYSKKDEYEILTKRICINKNCTISYHSHALRTEIWTFISGTGELVINGKLQQISAGDVVKIPTNTQHAIKAITDLEFIEVQSGSELIEEDVHRISIDWGDIIDQSDFQRKAR